MLNHRRRFNIRCSMFDVQSVQRIKPFSILRAYSIENGAAGRIGSGAAAGRRREAAAITAAAAGGRVGTFLVAMLALLVALATILPGAEDDFFATRSGADFAASGAGFAALAGLTGLAG